LLFCLFFRGKTFEIHQENIGMHRSGANIRRRKNEGNILAFSAAAGEYRQSM